MTETESPRLVESSSQSQSSDEPIPPKLTKKSVNSNNNKPTNNGTNYLGNTVSNVQDVLYSFRQWAKTPSRSVISPCSLLRNCDAEIDGVLDVTKTMNVIPGQCTAAASSLACGSGRERGGSNGRNGQRHLPPIDSDDEEESLQMHRLASWGTFGTIGTIETVPSQLTQLDDDGKPIHPKLLSRAMSERESRFSRKKRLVRFDYPPISSLKQFPRADQDDLPSLFFTEDELQQLEDDRVQTYFADDVEMLAISGTQSDENDKTILVSPLSSPVPIADYDGKFGSYISTPRGVKKRSSVFSFHQRARTGKDLVDLDSRRRFSPSSNGSFQNVSFDTDLSARSPGRKKRLLKSIQIFLRDRSSGR